MISQSFVAEMTTRDNPFSSNDFLKELRLFATQNYNRAIADLFEHAMHVLRCSNMTVVRFRFAIVFGCAHETPRSVGNAIIISITAGKQVGTKHVQLGKNRVHIRTRCPGNGTTVLCLDSSRCAEHEDDTIACVAFPVMGSHDGFLCAIGGCFLVQELLPWQGKRGVEALEVCRFRLFLKNNEMLDR
jgi:hypothetical protein